MQIREVSPEEKAEYIRQTKEVFDDIRRFMMSLENDMVSDDLQMQATAIWISGQFYQGYSDFRTQLRKMEDVARIQSELKDVDESSPIILQ